jgi:uncharacterized protein YbaR (Trm112 family)
MSRAAEDRRAPAGEPPRGAPEQSEERGKHDTLPGLVRALVCPQCRADVAPAGEGLRCTSEACGLTFPVRNGIPVMLVGGATPEEEGAGYYPKVKGGTMEDNPDPAFSTYDARIRTHYLRRYLEGEAREGRILDLCCSKAPLYPYLADWGFAAPITYLQLTENRRPDVQVINHFFISFEDMRRLIDRSIIQDRPVYTVSVEPDPALERLYDLEAAGPGYRILSRKSLSEK